MSLPRCATALLVSFVWPAAASRVNLSAELDDFRGEVEDGDDDYVNMEDFLALPHIAEQLTVKGKSVGYKCCCDKYGGRVSHYFKKLIAGKEGEARSGRCMIFAKTEYCKSVKPKPSWAAQPLSSPANAEQDCKVDKADVKDVYLLMGTKADYCTADLGSLGTPEQVKVAPLHAKLGQSVAVSCGEGHKPLLETAECMYSTAESGTLVPKPVCEPQVWCVGGIGSGEGQPTVTDTTIGKSAKVSCGQAGYLPVEAEAVCQPDHSFLPMPTCYAQTDFCRGSYWNMHGYPSVYDTALGQSTWIYCSQPGFMDKTRWTVCYADEQGNGYFDPQPECDKVRDYCGTRQLRDHPGQPWIDAGTIYDKLSVGCYKDGWENTAAADEVTCSEYGDPVYSDYNPLCQKTRDFCKGVSGSGDGEPFVHSTEVDEITEVVCGVGGYKPVKAALTCKGDGTFGEEPACEPIG